jgi:hypothetical protein
MDNEPTTINGKAYVFWPLNDPLAEEIVRVKDLAEFAAANAVAFERFRKLKYWH